MGKIIGIDLGSTLSEVSVMEGGKPTIIVNEDGSRTTPSVIYINGDERKIGSSAKRQAIVSPKNTVILIKRFMGGTYEEVKEHIKHMQYEVKNVNGMPKVCIEGKEYTPEELSAMILSKLKKNAEDYLGEKVTDAVITVPAFFDDAAKKATKVAGEIAGLNVKRLVAEPTAAILASNIDMKKGGKYMVADYGGSTLDFSVAEISDGVVEIKSSYGDVYCGGSDIDKIIADYIVSEFKKNEGIDLSGDPMAMSRVIESAEKSKIELSNTTTTEINLPYITAVNNMPKHLVMTITRAKFEQLIDGEITKIIACAKTSLKESGFKSNELNGILLVGGSTRIPKLQEALEHEFNVPLIKNFSPDEIVALGAATQGGVLAGDVQDILLLDVTPLNLGLETMGGVMTTLIDANTTIPAKKSQIFSTAVDNQPGVEINVLQGNRPMANQNKQIGIFHLDGIMPAPKGTPQIEVTFDIDANGILSVSAVDKATGKEQSIRIESKGGLSDVDIERMKKEAEEFAESDKKMREDADKINAGDAFAFQIEKALNELGDKVSEDEKKEITDLIEPLKKAVADKNVDEVMSAQQALQTKWYEISAKVYQAANPTGEGSMNMGDMFNQAGFNVTPEPPTEDAATHEE